MDVFFITSPVIPNAVWYSFLFTKDELDHDILHYFAALLAFLEHEDEPPGMNERENDVSRKLERDFDVDSHGWKLYRHHGWRCGIRGGIFSKRHNFKNIAIHIVEFKHDGRYWWESMIEAENDLLAKISRPRFRIST